MDGPTAAPGAHSVSSWVHWLGVVAATCAAAALATLALAGLAQPPAALPEVAQLEMAQLEMAQLEMALPEAAAPSPAGPAAPGLAGTELPELLSATGLYLGPGPHALHPEVLEFAPQYPLWSDGATKRRYLRLPSGAHIDGSNPNAWVFPVGTRFWKEFSLGRRIETRYIERRADGSWRFASYAWDADGREARLVAEGGRLRVAPLGVLGRNASGAGSGLEHDIPSRADCVACHDRGEGRAPILGFSALQLSADRDPRALHAETPPPAAVDLQELVLRGLLHGHPADLARPRIEAPTATARAALGYLHANCAGCHNARGALSDLSLDFEQEIGSSAEAVRVVDSVVGEAARFRLPGQERSFRVVPGEPEHSVVLFRLSSRQIVAQMPPLGSKVVDREATDLVAAWIAQMNPNAPVGAVKETP